MRFKTKFERGRIIIAGGSVGSLFTVYYAACSAKFSGCGLVVNLAPNNAVCVLEALNPLCKVYSLGKIQRNNNYSIAVSDLLRNSRAILIGPGADWKKKEKKDLVRTVLKINNHMPVVIDSDGLDGIRKNNLLKSRVNQKQIIVVIANFYETKKLLGDVEEFKDDDLRRFATTNKCYFLHKGHGFKLFFPNGKVEKFSVRSISRMAVAGMGDVLAGFLTGLLGRGVEVDTAARLSIIVRQKAAELFLKETPFALSVLPQDVIQYMPKAISLFKEDFKNLLED